MSKQQSSIDWLMEKITYDNGYGQRHNSFNDGVDLLEYFKQAKEMEDQQRGYSEEDLKQAFITGALTDLFNTWGISDENMAKEKFNEWFKQNKK
jgi:hypothetical protein